MLTFKYEEEPTQFAVGDYQFRTAVTRLKVSTDQLDLLHKTIQAWKRGCQIAADHGWEHSSDSRWKLQQHTYDVIREETGLGSQHAILAIRQAHDALLGVWEHCRRGQSISKPEFTRPTMVFDSRTMTIFDDESISLTTVDGRIRCGLALPAEDDGYQWQYLCSDVWELAESTLSIRDRSVYLHLGFRRHAPPQASESGGGTALGVDLGIENIAVTSTAYFASGKQLLHRHRGYEKVRGNLQQTGTESAHRTLQRLGNREERHSRDFLHGVSNDIVSEARVFDCTHIVFEDLANIRARTRSSKFHLWAHRLLIRFVRYKAADYGITVVLVNPQDTSRRCSECDYVSKRNRRDRATFMCRKCGMSANADYNAAKNIGMQFVRRGQQTSWRTGHRQLALKSGTVTPNGRFKPYPNSGSEAENTDKPDASR